MKHLRAVLLFLVTVLPLSVPAWAAIEIAVPEPRTVAEYQCKGIVDSKLVFVFLPRPDGRIWLMKHSQEFGSAKYYTGTPLDLHTDYYSLYSDLYFNEAEIPPSKRESKTGMNYELGGKYTLIQDFIPVAKQVLSVASIADKRGSTSFRGKRYETIRMERTAKKRLYGRDEIFNEGTVFAEYSPELKVAIRYGRELTNSQSNTVRYTCNLIALTNWDSY